VAAVMAKKAALISRIYEPCCLSPCMDGLFVCVFLLLSFDLLAAVNGEYINYDGIELFAYKCRRSSP
jgi:hypothetical protein